MFFVLLVLDGGEFGFFEFGELGGIFFFEEEKEEEEKDDSFL